METSTDVENGKDIIIVLPSSSAPTAEAVVVEAPKEDTPAVSDAISHDTTPAGLVTADGQLNWDCPCISSMTRGSCGDDFKAAFTCYFYSKAEPKGVECKDVFDRMMNCFVEHPDEYRDVYADTSKPTDSTDTAATEQLEKSVGVNVSSLPILSESDSVKSSEYT